ncbi:MAG: sensor histidine kinase [Pseudomonadota bacterium]
MISLGRPRSVKGRLLAWIIVPITAFILIDTIVLYRGAIEAANTAYDRMLVTTAYSVGDALQVDERGLRLPVPYAALEVYEPEYSTRMIYAIRAPDGQFLSGDGDLERYTPVAARLPVTPALLHIYESHYGNAPVRVAAVYQPFAGKGKYPGVIIQIAELMENRTSVALGLLRGTLLRQTILLAVVVLATLLAVSGALRPLLALKQQLDERGDTDLAPLVDHSTTPELGQVVAALNTLMGRVGKLLGLQQRFVSDASHQLRTPLAVLKAQIQSGLRGDAPALGVLAEIAVTTDRAVNLADKMLSLAKVEQLRDRGRQELCDLALISQDVAIELSPLISEKNIDFSMEAGGSGALGHPWMVSELISNLVHNAVRHTPHDGRMGIRISEEGGMLVLTVWDSGEGMSGDIRDRLFEPFAATHDSKGCGLGLTIRAEIAKSMGATLGLSNRMEAGVVAGLDARLCVPHGVTPAGAASAG